jgi:malonyl-CoA O-methyltransferase
MNTPFQLDSRSVRRWFDRASDSYAAAAVLQNQACDELLSRLQFFSLSPQRVLDLGAGLGAGTQKLRQRFPRAHVIAVDLAPAMLLRGADRRRFWRRPQALCADVRRLPIASGTVDLAYSNLMLQWCDQPWQAFAEIARVLKPGGLLLASTFGPLTLQELRSAWASADQAPHVSQFPDLPDLGSQLSAAGFQEPVLDIEQAVRYYPDALALQRELQALGARNADRERRRTLTGKTRWRAMTAQYESLRCTQGLPATWELIYMAAFASGRSPPAVSVPGEQSVPVDRIRLRTRP